MSYLRNETNPIQKEFMIQKSIDKFLSLVTKLKPEYMLLEIYDGDNTCLNKIPEKYGHELLQQLENTHISKRILHKINSDNCK